MLFPATAKQPDGGTSSFFEIHGISVERVYARSLSTLSDVESLRQNIEVRAKQNGDLAEDENIALFNIQQPSGQVVEVLSEDMEAYFRENPGCSLRAVVGRRLCNDVDGGQAASPTPKQASDGTPMPIPLQLRRPIGTTPEVTLDTQVCSEDEERLARRRAKNREKQARWRQRQRENGSWAKKPKLTAPQQDMDPLLLTNVPHTATTVTGGHAVQLPSALVARAVTVPLTEPFQGPAQTSPQQGQATGGAPKRDALPSVAAFQPFLSSKKTSGQVQSLEPLQQLRLDDNSPKSEAIGDGEGGSVSHDGRGIDLVDDPKDEKA